MLYFFKWPFIAPKFKNKSVSLVMLEMNDFIECDLLLFVPNIEHL